VCKYTYFCTNVGIFWVLVEPSALCVCDKCRFILCSSTITLVLSLKFTLILDTRVLKLVIHTCYLFHLSFRCILSPPQDNIRVMVIVYNLRGNIIRTALCWIV